MESKSVSRGSSKSDAKSTKSFMQYQLCTICYTNHNKGRKHALYSKQHKTKLDAILTKFSKKISEARQRVSSIAARQCTREELPINFWCHCCADELPRHFHRSDAVVEDAGILLHLASVRHREKVQEFWKWNFLPETSMDAFIMSDEELLKLKEEIDSKMVDYEQRQQQLISREADKIRMEAVRRARVHDSLMRTPQQQQQHQHGQLQQTSASAARSLVQRGGGKAAGMLAGGYGRVRTVGASGEGLTFIGAPRLAETSGNVHTGALPPWLVNGTSDADSSSTRSQIGPTAEDLQKHLERQKKRRLPAERVGAKFDHQSTTHDDWLPAFGGVWTSNSRTHHLKATRRSTNQDYRSIRTGSDRTGSDRIRSVSDEVDPLLERREDGRAARGEECIGSEPLHAASSISDPLQAGSTLNDPRQSVSSFNQPPPLTSMFQVLPPPFIHTALFSVPPPPSRFSYNLSVQSTSSFPFPPANAYSLNPAHQSNLSNAPLSISTPNSLASATWLGSNDRCKNANGYDDQMLQDNTSFDISRLQSEHLTGLTRCTQSDFDINSSCVPFASPCDASSMHAFVSHHLSGSSKSEVSGQVQQSTLPGAYQRRYARGSVGQGPQERIFINSNLL